MNVAGRISVLVVDRHPIVRYGVRGIIERDANIEVVGEADSLTEALSQARSVMPDIIIGELSIPDVRALEEANTMVSLASVRLVAFSNLDSWDQVQMFFQSGGMGFVSKRSPLSHLIEAVKVWRLEDNTYRPCCASPDMALPNN